MQDIVIIVLWISWILKKMFTKLSIHELCNETSLLDLHNYVMYMCVYVCGVGLFVISYFEDDAVDS